ncbi:MAG: 30S ribosomal protein S8e [Nanoarchaeota archaeon]|nr:30S ribosomal protein S8e [Nanoarchaeota archaeon]
MVVTQWRSRRKESGALYKSFKKKRVAQIGREAAMTKVEDKPRTRTIRTRAGGKKKVLLATNIANLLDKKTNKFEQVKILSVVDSPSNRNFVRRSIMTKGTVVETEKGKAKITSKPGQDGTINAVLI